MELLEVDQIDAVILLRETRDVSRPILTDAAFKIISDPIQSVERVLLLSM